MISDTSNLQNEGAVLTEEVSQALQNTLLSENNDEDEENVRQEKKTEQSAKKTDYIEKQADVTETDEVLEDIEETDKTKETDETLDMAFDACIVIAEDKMSVSVDFSQVKDILRKKLDKIAF